MTAWDSVQRSESCACVVVRVRLLAFLEPALISVVFFSGPAGLTSWVLSSVVEIVIESVARLVELNVTTDLLRWPADARL